MKCKLCGAEKGEDIDTKLATIDGVCLECTVKIDDNANAWREIQRLKIESDYTFYKLDKLPKRICRCGLHNDVIVFDYFTEYDVNRDTNFLCLCCLCRNCLGYYKVSLTGLTFPMPIKEPPSINGIKIIDTNIKTNKEDMIYL